MNNEVNGKRKENYYRMKNDYKEVGKVAEKESRKAQGNCWFL